MINFVNAKINIGLNIVQRRHDGYHDLQTLFYPIGLYAGTPENPVSFCDIIEIQSVARKESGKILKGEYPFDFTLTGRQVDCPPEKNLVVRAAKLFADEFKSLTCQNLPFFSLTLEKHLPDGAGLGGGSADASFVLRMLNEIHGSPFSELRLIEMASRLGADCPFFILNYPCYAEGIGEILRPSEVSLAGKWLALVKPDIYVSTREAFAGVRPAFPSVPLQEALRNPVESWRGVVINDFEASIFPLHPEMPMLKESLYGSGALYASMSGSGSSIYGIFSDKVSARKALDSALSLLPENSNTFSSVLKM